MSKAKFKIRGLKQVEESEVNVAESTIERKGRQVQLNELVLEAPVQGTIYGVLLNYKGALDALGDAVHEAPYKEAPKAPILYIKPANTVIGYGMPVPMPADIQELEIGAALGIVIGRDATRVREEDALQYIAGYTVVNDVSIPHESVYRPAIRQKARDGFCPVGPWIVERDAIENPDSVSIRVYINDVLKQENTTENLIRPVAQLLADITDFMTLKAGDVLLVGVPEGAPLAKVGDTVRIEIDRVGTLESTIKHEEDVLGGAL